MVDRKAVHVRRHYQDEQEEPQPWDDVLMEGIERLLEQMAEGDDYENDSESKETGPYQKANENEATCDEFNERNGDTGHPERPRGQKGILIRQKPALSMANGRQGKHLEDAS